MIAEDGGPAFPREDYLAGDGPGQRGMTLRDYFAAKAMHALVADPALTSLPGMESKIAKHSYVMADAMLEARQP